MYRSEEELKRDMLKHIRNTVDKSENSLVHDAISPASIELANFYVQLETAVSKLDVENLEEKELEQFVYQRAGLTRKPATKARVVVRIEGDPGRVVSRGDMVATETITFIIRESDEVESNGFVDAIAECEEPGIVGNVPAGAINRFPVSIPGLTGVTNPEPATGGYDTESDEALRERYYEKIQTPAISGNKHHYRNWAKEVPGVGDARPIPLWDGPGTVKVVIIDSNKQPVGQDLVDEVTAHIEEERPIGAAVTVVSASPKTIDVQLIIIKDDMFTLEQVQASIEENIRQHLEEVAFKQSFISYAYIGKLILESKGVLDYSNLRVNGNTENIPLEYEEAPILGEVVLSE